MVERVKGIEKRLTRLFEDIRGFAAPIQLERATVSIAEVWQRAWVTATRTSTDPVEFIEETGGEEFRLSLDPLRLEQVFRNLFDNSLAVCTPPARITISCSTLFRDGKKHLHISVRDNGPGLSLEAKKRVFEPFFTTKSIGTGLGMPICKRIIEAHGGDLQVGKSKVGAELVISLPLDEETGPSAEASAVAGGHNQS